MNDPTLFPVRTWHEMQHGKDRPVIDAQGDQNKTRMQKVPRDEHMTIAELLKRFKEFVHVKYLPHYFVKAGVNLAMALRFEWLLGKSTLLLQTDFAAQVQHLFADSLTCSSFNMTNVAVFVASNDFEHVDDGAGGVDIKCKSECWFVIGGTKSKGREQDSHFHNSALDHIVEHYKKVYDEMTRILLESDGCPGQYKVSRASPRRAAAAPRRRHAALAPTNTHPLLAVPVRAQVHCRLREEARHRLAAHHGRDGAFQGVP